MRLLKLKLGLPNPPNRQPFHKRHALLHQEVTKRLDANYKGATLRVNGYVVLTQSSPEVSVVFVPVPCTVLVSILSFPVPWC